MTSNKGIKRSLWITWKLFFHGSCNFGECGIGFRFSCRLTLVKKASLKGPPRQEPLWKNFTIHTPRDSGWWFCIFVMFTVHPYFGKWSNLTDVYQMGWNDQLGLVWSLFWGKLRFPLFLFCLECHPEKKEPKIQLPQMRLEYSLTFYHFAFISSKSIGTCLPTYRGIVW